MELCCVPLLAGLLVAGAYYFAHQRGYERGYREAVETRMLMDLGAGIERAEQENFKRIWHGTGEEGHFEGIGHLIPEEKNDA